MRGGSLCPLTPPTTTWRSCAMTRPGYPWLHAGYSGAQRRTLRRCQVAQVEGSALVAQAIQREGIEVLFGLAGRPIQDMMGFAPHCGVRPISVHHEHAA